MTIEDLLEEIVGEIRDEYDVETEPVVDEGNGSFVFSAKVNIDEVRERLGVEIEPEGFETVGGYVLTRVGRVPAVGETFELDGLFVEVLEAERRRIHKVRCVSHRRRSPKPSGTPMPKAGYVSLVGRPNAGKSTLLNRIIGEKIAIVSDKPQTTRTRILAVKNYPDGQIVFVDTPGIHRPLHRLNVRMVDAAVETLREVDVVALVFDASTKPGHGDEFVSKLLKDVKTPVVLVLNKIDLVAKTRLLPLIEHAQQWHEFAAIVPVSAATGDGVERLERVLLEQMPEGQPGYPDDYLTDQPERVAGRRDGAREGPAAHARRAAVLDRRRRRRVRRGGSRSAPAAVLHHLRRDRVAEADRHRPRRGDDQADRHRGAPGSRSILRHGIFLDLRVKVNPHWRDNDRVLDDIGVPKTVTKTRVARSFSRGKEKPSRSKTPAARRFSAAKPKRRKR